MSRAEFRDPTCRSIKEEFNIHLDALTTASTALNESLAAHLAEAQSQRNILVSPIHTLPNEILARIFELSMAARADEPREPVLLKVTFVCRFWKQIVLCTPSLWSVITFAHRQDFVSASLDHSQSTPLDIHFDEDHSHSEWDESRFIALIQPHFHRTRSLTLNIDGPFPWRGLLSMNMPYLHDICVSVGGLPSNLPSHL